MTETETVPVLPEISPKQLYGRITLRVAPFLILLYIVAFLDRVNVSFASLTMNHELHIEDSVFGFAAGIFFLGYLLFAVPGNLLLIRLGANRWIAIIMVAWGVLSCSMAFIHSSTSYVVLRFLIGAAEASFFPGVILYLTRWLPNSARGSLMALFTMAIPLSNIIGGPVSAAILSIDGTGGLHGWQWLFLLEGAPSILLGLMVPFVLANGPAEVQWLRAEEKRALASSIEAENQVELERRGRALQGGTQTGFLAQLSMPGLMYFCLMLGLYALSFWVPRILSSHGIVLARLGWATAVPYVFGAVGMVVWGRRSDRSARRQLHLAAAFLTAALGMLLAALAGSWPLALAGFSLAGIGVLSAMPIFWAALSQRIDAARAPAMIAAVNSVGNIGGFVGPYAMGWLLQRTHRYMPGLMATAAALLIGAGLVLLRSRRPSESS